MITWRDRPRGAAAVAMTAALSLALLGCTGGQPSGQAAHGASGRASPGKQAGQAQPSATGQARFGWFRPDSAPAAWRHADLPGKGATLSYPGTLLPMRGDRGTVTAGLDSPSGATLVYLNATPQQGDETLRNWTGFRMEHLREDGETAVHLDGVSPALNFRGGQGTCVMDHYTTKLHGNHYQEIACFVQGAHAASVLVAATSTATWPAYQTVLDRVVSSYQVG